jgi:hypothetical protein
MPRGIASCVQVSDAAIAIAIGNIGFRASCNQTKQGEKERSRVRECLSTASSVLLYVNSRDPRKAGSKIRRLFSMFICIMRSEERGTRANNDSSMIGALPVRLTYPERDWRMRIQAGVASRLLRLQQDLAAYDRPIRDADKIFVWVQRGCTWLLGTVVNLFSAAPMRDLSSP